MKLDRIFGEEEIVGSSEGGDDDNDIGMDDNDELNDDDNGIIDIVW